mmetsp:Transcript_67487/g.171316  ORF Transcript_67487/g.171316 Transcript_67487/m.171316 type:complete len:213 (+) Transcript_67487:466-1104(+)
MPLPTKPLLKPKYRGGINSSLGSVAGGGPNLVSSSCPCNALKLPKKAAARKGTVSARAVRPVIFCSTVNNSLKTPLRISSVTASLGKPPGSTTAKNTAAVGQIGKTVWHKFTRSSPTWSQAWSASSASTSASEPRGVLSHLSSAAFSSRPKRCEQVASRKAQLTETGMGLPCGAPSAASSEVLKSKFRHIPLAEFSRRSRSNAAAMAAGPAK